MDKKTLNAAPCQQVYFYTGNYPTGLYLVHIAAGKQTRIFKLLVKNL
jgi:hypothetical protein